MSKKPKVMVAMSGGVDSTMAAVLLVDQGYEAVGGTLKLADSDRCCLIFEAKSTCADLGIPYHVLDAKKEFKCEIIDLFISEYHKGRTPSPCIRCNSLLKFGTLLKYARDLGCDYIATGHYAQVIQRDGRYLLKKGIDPTKDQTYYLFELSQDQLKHTMFPLGGMTKTDVRQLCREKQFPSAEQADSQDLCFVPRSGPKEFLEENLPELNVPGDLVDVDGKVMGQHKGICHYTVGQRKGIGLHGGPWFVIALDMENNRVIIGRKEEVRGNVLELDMVNWMMEPPTSDFRCNVRIRYNHREAPAVITPTGPTTAKVIFDEDQFAITPGQGAAFFEDDILLGGGWIK
jgi:tRNA-specific 2-thiouridylase